MSRRTSITVLVVTLGCAVAVSPHPVAAQKQSTGRPDRNPAIALLRKNIDKIDWVDKPFEEVVSWLWAESDERVNIIPRWNALSVDSVDADTTVNLQLSGITVADILNETIQQLSEDGEVHYRAQGNKLTISTKSDFSRKLELRIYDASDILFPVPNFGREAPLIDLSQTTSSGGGGGGGGGGSGRTVFGTGGGGTKQQGGEREEQELEERLEELGDLIEALIEPESWANGGGRGRISVFNSSLLVLNTVEVHERIAGAFSYGK